MLKELINTSGLAHRYYALARPGLYSNKRAAMRQFSQDAHIDKRLLKKAAKQIANEVFEIIEKKY